MADDLCSHDRGSVGEEESRYCVTLLMTGVKAEPLTPTAPAIVSPTIAAGVGLGVAESREIHGSREMGVGRSTFPRATFLCQVPANPTIGMLVTRLGR